MVLKLTNSNVCIVTDPVEIANILNDHFQSVLTQDEDDQMPTFEPRCTTACSTPTFDAAIVGKKLTQLDVYKSIGIYRVSAFVLKECASSISIPLAGIFNKSIRTCPDIWKKAHITPLFKKGSKLDCGNYRLISLTSVAK
jgi:hypothetical protein